MSLSAQILPFLWPTVALMAVLLVSIASRRLASDVRPIFVGIVGGVAKSASSNAQAYAIAIMFGLSASLSAFYDVFSQMDVKAFADMTWHQYAAMWSKVLNPFLVAVLAYATQNKFVPKGSGSTNPPFAGIQPTS